MRWNFKSELVYYEVPGNKNRKMSQGVYIDSILEPVFKPWLETEEDLVLEKDGDSGQGSRKSNIMRDWKYEHNLKYYFNCAHCPHLSHIKNCWQVSKKLWKDSHIAMMRLQLLQSSRDRRISLKKKSMSG